jgi:hypothetical protein
VKSWMPTRLHNGEGRADREETNKQLFRSTGVVSTACEEGGLGNWGRPGSGGGRTSTLSDRMAVSLGIGEGRMTDEAG